MSFLEQMHSTEAAAPAVERETPIARLGLTDRAVDPRQQIYDRSRFGRDAVEESEDLERILALPRRPRPTDQEQFAMAAEMTARLRRYNAACACAALRPRPPDAPATWSPCITRLLPIQGWYLFEAAQLGGALGHIVVGGGKTGIDILLAMVMPSCKRAVLLIPPNLRKQFDADFVLWGQHFRTPNLAGSNGPHFADRPTLDVLAYSELSSPRFATWLKAQRPDALIGDECQNLKDKGSVRTDRFLRFHIDTEEAGAPPVPFFGHSGTVTDDSLDDYGHLSALALRAGSPVPLETSTLGQWCEALDPVPGGGMPRRAIGALRKLCINGERARDGFRRRLIETRGVITTQDAQLGTRLQIRKRDLGKLPPVLESVLAWTRNKKIRPDGEELVEIVEVATVCRQLACGFFYRWRYPRGEPPELIDEWFARRQNWHRELREKLEHRTDVLDSPRLCMDAAMRGEGVCPTCEQDPHAPGCREIAERLPVWRADSWARWAEIADQVQPIKDTVWIDDYVARDAATFASEAPAIVWYIHTAYGMKVSELANAPLYASGDGIVQRLNPTPAMLERREKLIAAGVWEGGDVADNWIQTEDGTRSIVCSIRAHGTGKNLQAFRRALVANPPVKGWEQLLGRMNRTGQVAPVIDVQVYRHSPEIRRALDDARELALYVQETTGKSEQLCYAEMSV